MFLDQQETVTLGCFWVFFWPGLPKIMSILFDILTSDDMQSDASDMLRFLLKREQIGPKS